MKKLSLFLAISILITACVDKDYDLSNIKTDDIGIGDETSEFRIPLATVKVGMAEIKEGGANIEEIFSEADLWLPSPLPNSAQFVDFAQFSNANYIDALTTALLAQMRQETKKCAAVRDLIWDKYRNEFLHTLNLPVDVTKAQYQVAFDAAIATGVTEFQQEIRNIAGRYITQIKVQDVHYVISNIDLSSDVVDMLADNLDPQGTPNAKNTLHLYGEITSQLPLSMQLHPTFSPTQLQFTVDVAAGDAPNMIAESNDTRLYEEDLRQIVAGTTINIPLDLRRYYPAMGFKADLQHQIVITLRLIKRGGLKLDL
ncbi:MAG: hypothetical protein RRY33_07530 [Alistipes sp.]